MPQFIYTLKPVRHDMLETGPTEAEEAVVGSHFVYLSDLKEKGVVKLAGRTTTTGPESFGIVILEVEEDGAARAIRDNDPAVKERVLAADLQPVRIALFGDPPED